MNTKKGHDHRTLISRLNRIEGQVRGISKMIEGRRYCTDILVQLKATKAAIARVEAEILEKHLDHCVHSAVASPDPDERASIFEEIRNLLKFR